MPIRYVIDKEQRIVISTASGVLTFAETKAHQDQLKNDPDFIPEFNQLIDMTAVTDIAMSTEEAKTIASRTFFSASSRRAWVAAQPAIFGMGRLMQVHHEMEEGGSQVCVFYARDPALKWLGVETLP